MNNKEDEQLRSKEPRPSVSLNRTSRASRDSQSGNSTDSNNSSKCHEFESKHSNIILVFFPRDEESLISRHDHDKFNNTIICSKGES